MVKSTSGLIGEALQMDGVGALSTPFDDLASAHAEYETRIYRFLLFSLRDAHAAASLTQDTFLTAWRTRATFRGDCSAATWLMKIAVNLMQNHVRGGRFRFWARVERSAIDAMEVSELLPATGRDAESALVARQRLAEVFRLVQRLPVKQRTAFLLRFNDDLDLPDIAAAMSVSLSAAKTHLYRALERVRSECADERHNTKGTR